MKNNLKRYRQDRLIGVTELAKIAGVSPITIMRIEKGKSCRMSTKRKIILALGLKISEKKLIFKE